MVAIPTIYANIIYTEIYLVKKNTSNEDLDSLDVLTILFSYSSVVFQEAAFVVWWVREVGKRKFNTQIIVLYLTYFLER